MSDVFISYARQTAREAHQISDALRALGYGVWLDDELPPHRSFSEVIEEWLGAAKAVVVVWSADALKSEWVQSEADRARSFHKLVQLSIDHTAPPMPFDRIQCVDLADWTGNPEHPAWRKVASSVAQLVRGEAPTLQSVALPLRQLSELAATRRRRLWLWGGAAAAVAVASGGLWLASGQLFGAATSAPHRVAVLPFAVIGAGPQAVGFAKGLVDDVVGALSADQVEAGSRAGGEGLQTSDGAAAAGGLSGDLMLDGDVQTDGQTLRVRMHLDDPRSHETLWSKELSGPASDPETLQERVASRAATVAKWAVSPTLRSAWKDPSVIAAYLEGEDELTNEGGGHAVEIARDIIERAPKLAAGHLLLAAALVDITAPPEDTPMGVQPPAVAESIKEAKIALALDPKSAQPWAQLALDTPLWAWGARERLLAKALAAEPDNPFVAGDAAWFQLYQVGRNLDAVAAQKRDLPEWVSSLQCLAAELVNIGMASEAWATIVNARRLAPDYWETPITQFIIAAETKRYADALALLNDPAVQRRIKPEEVAIYRQALQAAASGEPAEKKVVLDRVTAAARDGTLLHRDALTWLAGFGDVDGAFREADLAFTAETMSPAAGLWYGATGGTGVLFSPSTEAMRRDPRFMRLAARIGLVDYWRSTGHWPDFCLQPGFPYDCKVEAERVERRLPEPS